MKIPVGIPVFVAAAGTDPRFAKLVHRWLFSAAFWLIVASLDGLLLAVRRVDPSFLDGLSHLYDGRMRPAHTFMALFGWLSLGLVGLCHYVIAKSSQVTMERREIHFGNLALLLWNVGLVVGVVSLGMGHNTGREYREVPIFAIAPIALAVVLTFFNFYHIVARRKVHGVYISSWFILAACVWLIFVVVLGWMPFFRRGLADTVMGGYYIHNVVGMWFTPLAVGLTYYTLPKLLNKPIYCYGLGVLGFFTQLLFYTVIGTHHYLFTAAPDWLETVAVVFSVAMIVPVWASTGNFLLTMRGERVAISLSYSLPFIVMGTVAYGLASMQGSLLAFRGVQDLWHLTHNTVGHSHFAMYGFASFLLWGSVYGLVPRITGREPPVLLVGVHFWLSLLGVLVYIISMSIGGTAQGDAWIKGLPFMDSVRRVAPYHVWRVVGGALMLAGHVVFIVNLFKMRPGEFILSSMLPPPPEDPPQPPPFETPEQAAQREAAAGRSGHA